MTEAAPLVSVTICVNNGVRYLGEAIESALGQTYRPIEVVVIDDGSTDGSGDLARSFGPEVKVESQARAGIGASRNRAVDLASGSYFAFLDADDRYAPHCIERLMDAFRADEALDAAFAHVREFVSPDLDDDARRRLRPAADRIQGRLPTTMLVTRDAFFRVGPFVTNVRRGVTLDWSARALELGLRHVVLDDVLFERRLHSENNGLRERESTNHYVHVVKAALDRRRQASGEPDVTPS